MPPPRSRLLSRQNGFSTAEVVMASSLLVVLLLAIMPALVLGQRSVQRQSGRIGTLDDARHAMARITRDVRASAAVYPVDAQRVTLRTWANGALVDVAWDCSAPGRAEGTFRCLRTIAGKSTIVLEGLRNTDPFRFSTDRRYIELRLVQKPPKARQPMILNGAVTLRGCLPAGTAIQTCTGAQL